MKKFVSIGLSYASAEISLKSEASEISPKDLGHALPVWISKGDRENELIAFWFNVVPMGKAVVGAPPGHPPQ